MTQKVFILGGRGRVGSQIAADLLRHTPAVITVAGRQPVNEEGSGEQRLRPVQLDLDDREGLEQAIAAHDLVIHCAGPFSYRDERVLESCIRTQVNYLDIADHPPYVRRLQTLTPDAEAAGVTAILSTGVFPGISNSMVRLGVEALDQADEIHLSYGVAGSGGAGVTVLRTTFLEIQTPFPAWIDGQWQTVAPYSQRQRVSFPKPFGPCAVYWFHTIEGALLPESFPVRTVVTKFGSWPDVYNHLTWLMARLPGDWLQKPETVEFLARVSYRMTQVSDRFSGTGIAIRADVIGTKERQEAIAIVTFTHPDTAESVGVGTGLVAQRLLEGWRQPGVWRVEQALESEAFLSGLAQRGLGVDVRIKGKGRKGTGRQETRGGGNGETRGSR